MTVKTARERYAPGPATMAHVEKDGEKWTLVLIKELRHAPEKVWQALTNPAQLREWAPLDADGFRNRSHASRRAHAPRIQLGRFRHAMDAARRVQRAEP